MNLYISQCRPALLALVMCISLCNYSKAQQFQAQRGGGGLFGVSNSASSPEGMKAILQLRVEEMRVSLGLDEKQIRKLNLAVSVVSEQVFEGSGNLREARLEDLLPPQKNDDTFSDEDIEATPDRNDTDARRQRIAMPVSVQTALNHKTWKKAIDSILTDEQRTSFGSYLKEREKQIRKTAVQYRVWQLAEQLRLRQDQLAAVAEVVDRIEGEQLVDNLYTDLMGPGGDGVEMVLPEDLESILSEAQMNHFNRQLNGDDHPLAGLLKPLEEILGAMEDEESIGNFGIELDASRLLVKSVVAGSQAEKLGILAGDIVDEVNEKPVKTKIQIKKALRKDGIVSVTVTRGDKAIYLKAENK